MEIISNDNNNNMADDQRLKQRLLPTDSSFENRVPPSAASASAIIVAPPPSSSSSSYDGTTTTPSSSSISPASRAIDFLTLTRNLKTTKRTGWVRSGVSRPESIADHMYRMSLMAMIASRDTKTTNTTVDADRCVKLAIVHDLAEATVGDITPYCGVSDNEKHSRELVAMENMRDVLGPDMGGDEFLELWKEYEDGITNESRLVKDLDKIEMILQAQEYEAEGDHDTSLDGFFDGTDGKWRTEIGRAWAAEIVSRRRRVSPPEK